MQKIPTLFERDWDNDRSRVLNLPHKDCGWVFAGEGIATIKLDGTACRVLDGNLYKRRELKPGDNAPDGFEIAAKDIETGKIVGWVPISDGPEDRWHREAFAVMINPADGTYELVGPKIQGNPEKRPQHELIRHGDIVCGPVPRTFNELKGRLCGT